MHLTLSCPLVLGSRNMIGLKASCKVVLAYWPLLACRLVTTNYAKQPFLPDTLARKNPRSFSLRAAV